MLLIRSSQFYLKSFFSRFYKILYCQLPCVPVIFLSGNQYEVYDMAPIQIIEQ